MTGNPTQTNSEKKKKGGLEKDLLTNVNLEVVLGFRNQLTEERKEYHQRFLSISKLHVSLYQLQLWAYNHLYQL